MKKKTFTLIEILIVIAVFGTGILAVVYGLSQTLRMQDRADIMVYFSFLAREGIELMYNVRDANYAKKLDRNCIFKDATVSETQFFSEKDNPFCQGYFTGGDILMLSIGSEGSYTSVQKGERIDDFDKKFERYQLFYLTEKYDNGEAGYSFVYSGRGGDPLRYARYVELFPLKEGEKTLSMNKILKIESHVLYKKGELTGESIMESFIGNY